MARTGVVSVTEAQFTAQVIEMAQLHGYRAAHFRPARTEAGWRTAVQGDGKGFPDLVLVGRGRVIVAELKSEKGRPSIEQLDWLAAFGAAGVERYIWRPDDFDDILRILKEPLT